MSGTFNFPYHRVRTSYPDSGTRIQMGKSWVFPVKPESPDQRIFTLEFSGMKYFLDSNGNIDGSVNSTRNMKVLEDFYKTNQTWDTFTYSHPVHGNLTCRFNKPLEIPFGEIGGSGVVSPFEVELIEVPA